MMDLKILITAITALGFVLPYKTPEEVGIKREALERIEYIARRGISLGAYPGASIIVGKDSAIIMERGIGSVEWGGEKVRPAVTMYDLASLTKIVSPTLASMYLYDRGELDLYAPVKKYLPDFPHDDIFVWNLLSHTAGLPSGIFLPITNSLEENKKLIINVKLKYKPANGYLYSDLSAILLGWVIESITQQKLNVFVEDSIFVPLKLYSTLYLPDDSYNYRIAPTDFARGLVSDPTARKLGGVAGNAGVFSTSDDIAIIAQLMLNKGEINGYRVFGKDTYNIFLRDWGHHRALGWQLCNAEYGCGELSAKAFGHTGYTGTSLWIEPEYRLFVIVLTNRLNGSHTRASQQMVSAIRTDIVNIAMGADSMLNQVKSFEINKLTDRLAKASQRAIARAKARAKKHKRVVKHHKK